jgi:hemoglobin
MDKDSLFNRIGGKDAVQATVNLMYEKILGDPLLEPFFSDKDMAHLRRSQTAFMVMAFGGPHQYSGADLTKAHAGMVREKGLSDPHFNAVAGHLKAALQELGVPTVLIEEVLALVGTTRDAVLGRTA